MSEFICDEPVELTLVCLDTPYCSLNKEQRIEAQSKGCIFCTRLFEDINGAAEIVEPYFEGDDE